MIVQAAEPALAEPGATFDALAYEVAITPDFDNGSVAGVETIRLKIVGNGVRTLVFSPTALSIDSATVNGGRVSISTSDKGTTVALAQPLDAGASVTLNIAYHGVPARGVTLGDQSIYTSYWACDWMFCPEDAPGDKARFDLSLTLPPGMTSLSAGELVRRSDDGAGKVVHHWRSKRPYSAYLFGFAAGRFKRVEQRYGNADLVYLDATGKDAPLAKLFDQTPAMVDFLSEKAGLPLPAGHFTQLLVSGDEAQEATTYSLIGAGQVGPVLDDPEKDWVLIHELSHQWWGNLVTCRTWQELWLNEGMAVFMTAAWKGHRFGHMAYQAELDVARERLKRASDMGWDRPLTFVGKYPSVGVRRAIQYSKGALFLDHLRTRLGDEVFWRGLKVFTRSHAGGTVVSADFQRAMEKASGKDLSVTFSEWVYGNSNPV